MHRIPAAARLARWAAAGLLVASIAAGVTLTGVAPASASSEAYGIVAVHNGGWGYQEIVYGKGTTRQIANAPWWDAGIILTNVTPWAIPLAVTLWTIKYRAQDAVNTGQCYALVRPFWGAWYFAAKESWGCR